MLVPGGSSRPGGSPTLEGVVASAGRAIVREDWTEAHRWLVEARRLAPSSGPLAADLAFVLARLGRHEEALPVFEEAWRLGVVEGETMLECARSALAADHPLEEAERWLIAALRCSPTLVVDADEAPFLPLRGRAPVEEAMAEAWRRIRGDSSGDTL
jgi:Flp pilus assembly protein TadD